MSEGWLHKARRGAGIVFRSMLRADTAPALLGSLAFALVFICVRPIPSEASAYSKALYAASGELIDAQVAPDGQWRFAPVDGVPENYISFLLQFEDKRFYGHTGFDPWAAARALVYNTRRKKIVSGASTLTMQIARLAANGRVAPSRTLGRKLLEVWAALRMELFHTKRELLNMYANAAPFGANVVGLSAASFRWFGRPVNSLSLAEAACLAVLPNSPGLIHVGRARSDLKIKRDTLLEQCKTRGIISDSDYALACMEPLPKQPRSMPDMVPHLLAKARPGATRTTLDYAMQRRVHTITERHAARLGRNGIRNLAVLVLRVRDSSVAAYMGNKPLAAVRGEDMARTAPWVDCALSPRSSGSILKPFLYAAMLESGELCPDQLVPDIPTRVGSYSPENNLKTFSGAAPACEALAKSLNVPFVRLLRSYGVERFASLLKRLGISTLVRAPADYGLTLIVGGAEVNLAETASAYGFMARTAAGAESAFTGIVWKADDISELTNIDPPFSAGSAWLTLSALLEVARPAEEASWQEYANSRRIAWKTGTSYGSKDAWAIGLTSDYVVAVWAGNADGEGRPEIKGTDAAAPVLFDIFGALPPSAWFAKPADELRYESVCAFSGYIAGQNCESARRILVPRSAHAFAACPYCRLVHLSADGLYQVRAELARGETIVSKNMFVLPPALEWYYSRLNLSYKKLPPWHPDMADQSEARMDFITPEEGNSLYIPIELDGRAGKTVFRAVHRNPSIRVFWHLDGGYMGETRGEHAMELRPEPGKHSVTIIDENGYKLSRSFYVYERE